MCEPVEAPESYIQILTAVINSEAFQGTLCLKACKSELAACKKVSTSVRKCKDAASKGFHKTQFLLCQLDGFEKKTCTEDRKAGLKFEREQFRAEFTTSKSTCEIAHAKCKGACVP